ncbi:hypothetical protein V5O48_002314 [Marasmius crinis-equi]|uniref:BHLH domain-containing protein n=1 Tax=Marasmius crinis-equi TaxID=585013 RepID=A0ABR3FW52_9AGAR
MTEKKRTASSKNPKGKQLNQTSLLDLFAKKQSTAKKASAAAGSQERTVEADIEAVAPDERQSSPVPVQRLAAVAISVEPESPKSSTSTLPRTPNYQTHVVVPEIIDIADDQDPDHDIPPEVIAVEEPGTREDNPIVVLDSSPVKPTTQSKKKGASSHSQKATYSIFAPRTQKAQSTSSTTERTASNSSTSPVVDAPFPNRDLQHIRGPQSDFPHPLPTAVFPPRTRYPPPHASNTSRNTSLKNVIPTNYRDPELTQEPLLHGHPSFAASPSSSARTTHLSKNIPPYHRSHPIISHLIDVASAPELPKEDHDNALWADKWRPRRADHVLHNENHALYLRDWLSALELQRESTSTGAGVAGKAKLNGKPKVKKQGRSKGTKRQRVVRAVDKKAGRKRRKVDSDEDEDWIVSDHFVEEEEDRLSDDTGDGGSENEGDTDAERRPRLRRGDSEMQTGLGAPPKAPPRYTFTSRLTNTVLLTGPPGSGKTAAVYACAEELGWEVFEVYPGIGKRNASNLDNLVGDVGKNHLVRKAHGTNRSKEHDSSIKSLFLRKKRGEDGGAPEEDVAIDEETDMINNRYRSPSTDFGFVEQAQNISQLGEPSEGPPQVRQSLILLEEVDILYRDDANFWPAVVSLIKDCKRPVILTCNDLSLVPTADLPLQDIREFERCPAQVATSFLHALCCAEGYVADRDSLSTLCKSNSDYYASKGEERLDLRRTIQHCQMWSSHTDSEERINGSGLLTAWKWKPEEEEKIDLVNWTLPSPASIQGHCTRRYHTELLSFGDRHMIRNVNSFSTVTSATLDGIEITGDDVLGHPPMFTSTNAYFGDNYDRDEMIMSTAISMSRGSLESDSSAVDVSLPRVRYEGFVRQFRNNGAVSIGERYRRRAFDMEYLPWIRMMVEADDEQEKEQEKMKETQQREGRRSTRNSQKGQHVRTIMPTHILHRLCCKIPSLVTMPDDTELSSRSPLSRSPSSKDANPKLSPILPLAPLEYLQNQRRGSITDPSLHAAHKLLPPPFRPHADPSASLNPSSPSTFIKDNYTFGDATPRPSATDNTQLRKLLHSPSHEQDGPLSASPPNGKAAREAPRRASIDPLSLRRPSTTGPDAQSYLGKRKMSLDRGLPGVEDVAEAPSVGAGGMEVDMEGPAPKRRSSAVDARIAKLSLNDRRHSVDSRGMAATTTGPWWTSSTTTSTSERDGERRNSTSSTAATTALSATSTTPSLFSAINSANPGGEGRAPPSVAGFAWTTNNHPPAPEMHNDPIDPHSRPPFDPNHSHIPAIPPLSFPPERRMSAPDTSVPLSSTGPTRVLRSRSRPPSRQMRSAESPNEQMSPSPAQEDPFSQAQTPGSSSSAVKKETSTTPYSRSPELRVSHKLAERKRRKEMKDLFDELRDQLPADRGMKASKWEILSKAIDFVSQLKQSHQDMAREIDMLRGELEVLRQNPGLAQFPPGAPVVYGQGHPHPVPTPYPMHPPPGVLPHPPPPHPQQHPQQPPPPHPGPPQQPLSRPASSQNMYPPTPGPNAHPHPPPPGPNASPAPPLPQPQRHQNGTTITRTEVPPT